MNFAQKSHLNNRYENDDKKNQYNFPGYTGYIYIFMDFLYKVYMIVHCLDDE